MANQEIVDMDLRIGAAEAQLEDLTHRINDLEVATAKPTKVLIPKPLLEPFNSLLAAIDSRMTPGKLLKELAGDIGLKPGTLGKFRSDRRCGHSTHSILTKWYWKDIEPLITETTLLAFDTSDSQLIVVKNRSTHRLAVKMQVSNRSLFSVNPIYSIIEGNGEMTVRVRKLRTVRHNELVRIQYGHVDNHIVNPRIACVMMVLLNQIDVCALADKL